MGNITRTPTPTPGIAPPSPSQTRATPPTAGQTSSTTVQTAGKITVTVGAGGQGATQGTNKGVTTTSTARAGGTTTVVSDTGARLSAVGGAGSAVTIPPQPAASTGISRSTGIPANPTNSKTSNNLGVHASVLTTTNKAAAQPPAPVATTANKSASLSNRPIVPILTQTQIASLPLNQREQLVNTGPGKFTPPANSIPAPRPPNVAPPPVPPGNNGAVTITWDSRFVPPTPDRVESSSRLVTETIPAVYRTVSEPVYAPTYENRLVKQGGKGGGGGFSYKRIKVQAGDVVTIVVGATGTEWRGGAGPGIASQYKGGDAGTNATTGGRGGGGGGATVILVNGIVTAVAAGGGGGAGGSTTTVGTSGAPSRNSGISNSTSGQNSGAGNASGGGGGGGFWGGPAGLSGLSAEGGQGGVNLGSIIDTGNGSIPGGFNSEVYPAGGVGQADGNGAAIIDLFKTFAAKIKINGQWKSVDNAYVKIDNAWKEIYQGWTKVSGSWAPLVAAGLVNQQTYSLSANLASVDEGQAVSFTLTTGNVAAGTSVPWSAVGIQPNDLLVGSLQGNFTVGTSETITFVPRLNNTTNGLRTLTVSLNQQVAQASVTVNDTSQSPVPPVPSYAISANRDDIEEGTLVIATVTTANVGSGVLYWTIDGTVTQTSSYWQTISGGVPVVGNSGTFTLRSRFNASPEAYSESFYLRLRTGTVYGPIVASSQKIVLSKVQEEPDPVPPPAPVFSLRPTTFSASEGSNVKINVTSTNYGNGTLFWTVNHQTTSSNDFVSNNGTVTLTNDQGHFYLLAASDGIGETTEIFNLSLRTASITGAVVAQSESMSLVDVPPPPPAPTYNIVYSARTINTGFGGIQTPLPGEGQSLRFSVTTTDFGSGTLYWTVNHITTSSADFGANSGTVTITDDAGQFFISATADSVTEGTETFRVQLRTGSTSGTVVDTTATVQLIDTSKTPTVYSIARTSATVDEGNIAVFNVGATNFGSGTLYATVNSETMYDDDFNNGQTSYQVSVVNGAGTVNVAIKADIITDGNQSFRMQLREGSSSGTVLATSDEVTVNDTSITPAGTQAWRSEGNFTFTVPAGITKIRVTLAGGGGGATSYSVYPGAHLIAGANFLPGLTGKLVTGIISVQPGTSLTVKVGAGGQGGLYYGYNFAASAALGTLIAATPLAPSDGGSSSEILNATGRALVTAAGGGGGYPQGLQQLSGAASTTSRSLVPTGFTETNAGNGGVGGPPGRNGRAGSGKPGYVILEWGANIT